MTTKQNLPVEEIGTFLTDLYGLDIQASEDAGATCDPFGALATYADAEGKVRAQFLLDLPAAAALGAALTQVPAGAVEDAVKSGSLPDNLLDNLKEVFNIAVNVFPAHATERLVLKDVLTEAPADLGETTWDLNVKLDVGRYGASYACIAMTD